MEGKRPPRKEKKKSWKRCTDKDLTKLGVEEETPDWIRWRKLVQRQSLEKGTTDKKLKEWMIEKIFSQDIDFKNLGDDHDHLIFYNT